MIKKILGGLAIWCIAVFLGGCSDNSSVKPQTTKPVEKIPAATTSSVKLYSADLQITQSEFILIYNDDLKSLALNSGQDYKDFKINPDSENNPEPSPNGAVHFYVGDGGIISIFRNEKNSDVICAAMITAKTNYKLSDMNVAVEALTQAATQKQQNFQNVINFIQSSLQSENSNATNIDGLVVSYNSVGNYLTIIAENATVGNGFETMVDNIVDSAKMGSYWRN